MITRALWVSLHRWVGLAMAGFLVLAGVSGSLLAFNTELERLISPQLYAKPQPTPTLDLATLAENAARIVPQGEVNRVAFLAPDQVVANVKPRKDAAAGKLDALGFDQLFLDPWTGTELGRRFRGDLSQGLVNLMPFIYIFHYSLQLGPTGSTIFGVVALFWTFDCFVAFYLTLPVSRGAFWRRWKPAWLVKSRAGAYRLNFDLHRAGGLWLWLLLLVFAWSSVAFNLRPVYEPATRALLDYVPPAEVLQTIPNRPNPSPRLDWRAAQANGERMMDEQAAKRGFAVKRPYALAYVPAKSMYIYNVQSSLDLNERRGGTTVWFDGDTGAFMGFTTSSGEHSGNTVTSWLIALHMAGVFGLPYRILVCALGLVVAMLSVTGIYIWWKKRRARRRGAARGRALREASEVATQPPAE
ncbi:MAG: PepSY-associated TM helix domain-containing protein [Roseiarcus sp.]